MKEGKKTNNMEERQHEDGSKNRGRRGREMEECGF